MNSESGSSLPRLVPPTQNSSNKPESVMKATTDKSEPIMRSKTTYGVGGSKIDQSKTMIDVNNFNPGKKESTIDQHYSKYMNQWAPRSRKSNSNHRIVEKISPHFGLQREALQKDKVGCVIPMVISSEFYMEPYRDDDHREDAPHFIKLPIIGNLLVLDSSTSR